MLEQFCVLFRRKVHLQDSGFPFQCGKIRVLNNLSHLFCLLLYLCPVSSSLSLSLSLSLSFSPSLKCPYPYIRMDPQIHKPSGTSFLLFIDIFYSKYTFPLSAKSMLSSLAVSISYLSTHKVVATSCSSFWLYSPWPF